LEEALIEGLRRERWTTDEIEIALIVYDVQPIEQGASGDPAENPMAMRRLEVLLDLLGREHWRDPPEVEDELPGLERQTFDHGRTPAYIRMKAPREVAADWKASMQMIRRQLGPGALDWHAAVIVIEYVQREWSQVDPESKPKHIKVFERDRYRCLAPGCPKRGELQGHHGKPRSRGGSNALWNLISLCFLFRIRNKKHYAESRIIPRRSRRVAWLAEIVLELSA
jgi:5-methylcytosine-specific restriction endonuclease McrA